MNTLLMNEEMYHRALANVVHAAYKSGNVVIVGRGSQVLLSEQRDVLHVRVVAPLEMRITYVVQREVMERDQARTRVQQKDRQRSRYLQNLHQRDSNDAHLYDLVLNTAQLSLDDAVYLVCQALKMKEAHLSLPLEQLGPASNHITQYPGTPQDFPSSHSLPNP